MKLSYKVMDESGESKMGEIEASSVSEARNQLKTQGFKILKLEEKNVVKSREKLSSKGSKSDESPVKKDKKRGEIVKEPLKLRGRIKNKEMVLFCKSMVILLEAGIPILGSLQTIGEQSTNKAFKSIMLTVEHNIKEGLSLSESYAKFPHFFTKLFINMVKAGEESGNIVLSFSRMEVYYEKIEDIKKKVRKATTYPAVIIVVAIGLVTLLLTFVVPAFVKVFQDAGAKLPFLTQMMLTISDILKNYFLIIIAVLIVVFFLLKRFKKSTRGAIIIDSIVLRIPVINKLVIKIELSRFSRTMASLLAGGVPIMRCFEISEQIMGSAILRAVVEDTRIGIRNGKQIVTTLSKSHYIPRIMLQMIEIGEESGNLPEMFEKVADYNDKELEEIIETVVALIEPAIIVVLGGIIGVIVLSIYLPILSVSELVGSE
ncbi:MAG: type II secretion system F family protein [Fusobacteria bacterium]|nr:type II secretion system F family protein [Fusobacteriota bacterium]